MNRLVLALAIVAIAVSGCGIKRPLMRPDEIPDYEKKRADRMKKFDTPTPNGQVNKPVPQPQPTPSAGITNPQVIDMSGPAPLPTVTR